MKQLSGQDNSFLEIEGIGIPQHISSVAIYDQSTAPDGAVRFKDVLCHLKSRLHLSPIFRNKLQQVPMGLDHIDNVPKGSFALLIRIHHCVMDGASAVDMMAAIHDFGPEPRQLDPEAVRVIEQPQSDAAMLGRAYVNVLRKPRRFYNLGKKLLGQQRAQQHMPSEERTEGAKRLVSTRFNQELSAHRVLDAVTLDFGEVRAIKDSLEGATINDVMLTIVTGALHKYLKAEGELPLESLTCGCPIDIRDKNDKDTEGNLIGFMGVNLSTQIEDPMERFKAVHEAAVRAKAHAQASDVRIGNEILDTVPGGIMTTAMRATAAMGVNATPYNTMLTNVPGPPNQLYFAGAQIVEGFGIGPLVPGVGLFHTASSSVMNKEGKGNFSFWACRDMLPNPDFYKQCIEETYAELNAVTLAGKAKAKAKAKAKPKAKAKARKHKGGIGRRQNTDQSLGAVLRRGDSQRHGDPGSGNPH